MSESSGAGRGRRKTPRDAGGTIKRIFQSNHSRINTHYDKGPSLAVRVSSNADYRWAHSVHIQGPCVFRTIQRGDFPENQAIVEVAPGIPIQLLDENDQVIEELV